MTPCEIVLEQIHHRETRPVPFSLSFEPDQTTIPFGTPDDIRSEVQRLCREMGQGGGYILAPAKALQPETPTENAVAVVEAFTNQAIFRNII